MSDDQKKYAPGRHGYKNDKDFFTWSTFFSLVAGTGDELDRKRWMQMRDEQNAEDYCKECETWKAAAFAKNPVVRFLNEEIAKVGPALTPDKVRCRMCWDKDDPKHVSHSGGLSTDHGILLCANRLRDKNMLEDTLAHEMVHAYDHNRFEMDAINDLRHAACTEIRASTLSGECRFMREVFGRNQWGLAGKFQDCVRRRAALSVLARPQCGGDHKKAESVVEQVWESCFKDTRPFDEVYR